MPFYLEDEERNEKQLLPKGEIVGFVDPQLPAYRLPVATKKVPGRPPKERTVALKSELSHLR
jgi:hypothetical protein